MKKKRNKKKKKERNRENVTETTRKSDTSGDVGLFRWPLLAAIYTPDLEGYSTHLHTRARAYTHTHTHTLEESFLRLNRAHYFFNTTFRGVIDLNETPNRNTMVKSIRCIEPMGRRSP